LDGKKDEPSVKCLHVLWLILICRCHPEQKKEYLFHSYNEQFADKKILGQNQKRNLLLPCHFSFQHELLNFGEKKLFMSLKWINFWPCCPTIRLGRDGWRGEERQPKKMIVFFIPCPLLNHFFFYV